MKRKAEQELAGPPSKSQRKRDHRQLQVLAEALIALPQRKLRALPLAERTRDELELARSMPPSGARSRQLRLLAKLLETEDQEALQRPARESAESRRAATALQHRAERLRERLLAGDDGALRELPGDTPPEVPAQLLELRDLARNPLGGERAKRAFRDIFRVLLEASQRESGT